VRFPELPKLGTARARLIGNRLRRPRCVPTRRSVARFVSAVRCSTARTLRASTTVTSDKPADDFDGFRQSRGIQGSTSSGTTRSSGPHFSGGIRDEIARTRCGTCGPCANRPCSKKAKHHSKQNSPLNARPRLDAGFDSVQQCAIKLGGYNQ